MPKRVQDILPSHRSIRDISVDEIKVESIPRRSKKKVSSGVRATSKVEHVEQIEITRLHVTPPPLKIKKRKSPWIVGTALILLLLTGAAIASSAHFAKANFMISLKRVPVVVMSNTLVIPPAGTSSSMFGYKVITTTAVSSTTVPASLGTQTDTKAQGILTIYNTFSTQTQRLVAGTRLANDSGLIYKLSETVVVPGYKKTTTGVIPGSVQASIVADQSGDSYNVYRSSPISDFRVVAYKGLPTKYDAFYGRINADIIGGFSGRKLVVAQDVLGNATSTMQSKLLAQLQLQVRDIVPKGYVLYTSAVKSVFENPKVVLGTSSNSAQVSMSATVYGIILKKNDLAILLAGATTTALFGGGLYEESGIENLIFNAVNIADFSPNKKNSLVAKIAGNFMLVGIVQTEKLQKELAGLSIDKTASILRKYSSVLNISDSYGEIIPPWVNNVPSDVSRINIVVK